MERSKLITTLHAKGYRVTSKGILLNPKGVIIKGRKDRDGYPIMGMRYYGKCYNVLIHRLQAFQKYGAKMFDKGMEVRHLNGIKDDNCWDNIAIGTHSENMMDIPEHIRIAKALHATSFV